jgi:hypothetical protein
LRGDALPVADTAGAHGAREETRLRDARFGDLGIPRPRFCV